MKKSIAVVVFVVVLIFLGLFAILFLAKEVPILNVQAEVTVADDKPSLKIVTLEQDMVPPSRSPKGSDIFPAVAARAIINSSKLSYWPAVDYHGNGTYDLVIGFHPDALPKEGDMVKVVVTVVDERGQQMATDTEVLLWEEKWK